MLDQFSDTFREKIWKKRKLFLGLRRGGYKYTDLRTLMEEELWTRLIFVTGWVMLRLCVCIRERLKVLDTEGYVRSHGQHF